MVIKSISLQNYRNYRTLSLDFDPDTNIFYGDNAQGKTNILEAVYVSGTSRSHRSSDVYKRQVDCALSDFEAHTEQDSGLHRTFLLCTPSGNQNFVSATLKISSVLLIKA